jgi:putative phage-type endonuclease
MKIIQDISQGTDEWLNLRLGKATASNFSKIVTSTGAESKTLPKYALELASDMLVTEPEESYKSPAMERGNELEPDAREAYQQHTFNIVDEVAFFDCGGYGYSPDGLVGEDGLVEFKCPQATTHTQYLFDGKLPTTYKAQCQGGLMVTGRKWLDFVSYHPNFKDDKKLFIIRVERDEEFIKKLKAGIDKVIELRDQFITKIKGK